MAAYPPFIFLKPLPFPSPPDTLLLRFPSEKLRSPSEINQI